MKRTVIMAALVALIAVLSVAAGFIVKDVRVRQALTLEMRATDKYGYTVEQFADQGYVVHERDGETPERRAANIAIVNAFVEKVGRGEKAALHIVRWNDRDEPVFQHLYFNGRKYVYVYEAGRDRGGGEYEHSVCKDIRFAPDWMRAGAVGHLLDCVTERETFVVR